MYQIILERVNRQWAEVAPQRIVYLDWTCYATYLCSLQFENMEQLIGRCFM